MQFESKVLQYRNVYLILNFLNQMFHSKWPKCIFNLSFMEKVDSYFDHSRFSRVPYYNFGLGHSSVSLHNIGLGHDVLAIFFAFLYDKMGAGYTIINKLY